MFTGIIRNQGIVETIEQEPQSHLVTLRVSEAPQVRPGDSVAIQGVCLTVLKVAPPAWHFRLMAETLQRTTLGHLVVGQRVNIERPLRADQFIDGHLVLGHVDGVVEVMQIQTIGGDRVLTFRLSPSLMPLVVPKGSVALDGVSLTVVDVADGMFTVSLMPYTYNHTTLGTLAVGDQCNIEVDIIGKYVQRHLAALTPASALIPEQYQHS